MPSLRFRCCWLLLIVALGLFVLNLLTLLHLQPPRGQLSESREQPPKQQNQQHETDLKQQEVDIASKKANQSKSQSVKQDEIHGQSDQSIDSRNMGKYIPIYLGEDPSFHVNILKQNTHKLTVRSVGRLGNLMFEYAALLGIAQANHFIPYFTEGNLLWETFELSISALLTLPVQWPKFRETASMAYDYRTASLNYELDIELLGYFQCWKYFSEIEAKLRQEFTFKPKLRQFAKDFVRKALQENFPKTTEADHVVVVGVHVRRSDMLDPANEMRGYIVADRNYVFNAMMYFEAQYEGKIIFVVASDDMEWSKENVRSELGSPVVFSEGHTDREDLALLAHCDHVIMTVGTFGWWAAWLSGGTVIYYRNNIAERSAIDEGFEPSDYFYPTWIGLQ